MRMMMNVTVEAKLTPIEEAVKNLLEKAGVNVLKGSYPDFTIFNPQTNKFCLVEVKGKTSETLSGQQEKTMRFLRNLGIPCHVLHADSIKDLTDLERLMGIAQPDPLRFLSILEKERFAILAESSSVKDAAQKLGLAPGTLYNWLSDLRVRLVRERGHINGCLWEMERSPLLKKELSIRKAMTLPVENVEEVDEFDEQENPKD